MTEPRLSARGGNSRAHVPVDAFEVGRSRSRGVKLDTTQVATVVLAAVLSIGGSAVYSWFTQSAQVRANTVDIERMERSLSTLEQAKETTAVDGAALAAEVRTQLQAVNAQLARIESRLERIESRR